MNIMKKIRTKCPVCGKMNIIEVHEEDYIKYLNGGLVQNCFPYLNMIEREMLITGLCTDCQDKIFCS